MEADWDLQAVVRGCATIASFTAAANTSSTSFSSNRAAAVDDLKPWSASLLLNGSIMEKEESFSLSSPNTSFLPRRNPLIDFREIYKPFFPRTEPISQFNHSSSRSSASLESGDQPLKKAKLFVPSYVFSPSLNNGVSSTSCISPTHTTAHSQTNHRPKRRKNQQKKVCQVPAESLSSDIWSWRKYGQKPIKGSPYPRGYYRCSSSKGCLARKQVERNKSDPTMFIVTYTAEHNHPAPSHRNSLAGTSRHQKLFTNDETIIPSSEYKPCSSSSLMDHEAAPQQCTKDDSCNDLMFEYDEVDGMGFSDGEVTDDFFEGLDKFVAPVMANKDCSDSSEEVKFSGQFLSCLFAQ